MRKYFIATTLVALVVTGCGDRSSLSDSSGGPPAPDSGAIDFPIGTYMNCAQGMHNPDGNIFPNIAGFESGAVLTLAQSGRTVMATYVDQNGVTEAFSFSATTSTSATLAQPGQVIPGFVGLCVMGPGSERRYPARMTVTAGALTYDAGTVFVTVTGGLEADAGSCGTESLPAASFWILCKDRQGGALAVDAVEAPVVQLPVGQYACGSQVATYDHVNGMNRYVTGGGSGTLTLAEDGGKVTAQYSGDSSLAGTLRLVPTTSTTARAEAGQSLMTPCMVPVGMGGPSQTPEALPIAAGSLALNDSTLFIAFAGTMAASSSCPGAQVAGSVLCSK
ncbi:hypothetical protein [Sorangium sp. So ce1000]|uniref:hypothetical protein n=1 Tax=Sorangium sp. So ce1000 TaxID=3133325 RepID=UPI003F5F8287